MNRASDTTSSSKNLFSGGVMGKLISEFDWSNTPIGPPETWSESLKNLVNMMLVNRFPMLLWWGEHFVQIYNDAYIPVLGLKHPTPGLGRPGYDCWDEIWPVIGPLVDAPFAGGAATWMEDILLKVNRNNFIEETHFTIAYSPVPDASTDSGIGGVLATVNEITEVIISKRQMETLGKLGKDISSTASATEVYSQALAVLEENQFDIPFGFIHRIDGNSKALLTATAGIAFDHPELPQEIDFADSDSAWGDILTAVMDSAYITSQNDKITSEVPLGAWDSPASEFVHLPIRESKRGIPIAVVTLALNPYRKLDESYTNFVQFIADQISFGVTNAIAYEKERQKAEMLAELDKAKTAFYSNVSHEFRTPLTLMLGPIDDLISSGGDNISADRQVLELIQRNGYRLQKLVNTLLDFSRIEAGRMQLTFKPTDISKLTSELASNFTSAFEKAGLKLEVDFPDFSESVFLDEEMWEKIVLNLLSNAFKFTFEGKIGVYLKMVPGAVELSISDTGIGISEEDQKRVFDRFHRVPKARSRSFEGSGIGLALVNELVKLHGGTIRVESEAGKGTTFIVRIPRGWSHLPADQIQHEALRESPASSKANVTLEEALRWFPNDINEHVTDVLHPADGGKNKPTVVLADDNADMREYIKSILDEYCHVVAVGDGKQAFDLAREVRPDLILSDVMMPEIDGFELLKMIRQDHSLKTTPVILLSARAGEEAKVEGLQAGADDYLTKPFSRNELIARVKSNIQLSNVRKEIDEAINKSESRLRALVMATTDVIYQMSPDWSIMRQLDGRSFLQDTGAPLADWQTKYIHPQDQGRVMKFIREAVRTKSLFQLEHQVIRADGSTGWTLSRAIPILDRHGEILEWFGAATDVTDRKSYESEMERRVEERTKQVYEANAELKLSNEDLQQFAHVTSHDLKEPVRKIKTFTYRLMDDLNDSVSEPNRVYLRKILSSAERMSTMIDGVLAYSSFNGMEMETGEVDLNEVLEEVKGDLELLIQQKKAKIRSSALPVVVGGRLLLFQLFYNLISNSLKFSYPDRSPVIEIDWRADESKNGGNHIITFKDNGIGFDQDLHERIFEPFSRLNTKDLFDGTGLGLSLCRKIIRRHNGTISASGQKGKGATFTIQIPSVEQESQANEDRVD